MKKILYMLLSIIALSGFLSSCSKNDTLEQNTPTASFTNQPTDAEAVIPDSSIIFVFAEDELNDYNQLYHQLAYLKLQNAGYNVSSIYTNTSSNMQNVFSQLESSEMNYAIITSSNLLTQVQNYSQLEDSNITFILCNDVTDTPLTSYNIKLYEYYYLAGVALCNESALKIAGFVASSPDEQTIRCINAFALGMKSVDIDSKVFVRWAEDESAENISSLVSNLSNEGCDVFSYFMDGDLVEKAANAENAKYMTMSTHTFLNVDNNIAIKPNINLDKFYAGILTQLPTNEFSYLGIEDGIIGYELSSTVSDETSEMMNSAYANIQNGYEIFSGPIYSKLGLIVPADTSLPVEDILDMLWFVENVEGELPAG